MSDKRYTDFAVKVVAAFATLVMKRIALGRNKQAIKKTYRDGSNKRKMKVNEVKKYVRRPAVRQVLERQLNQGISPQATAALYNSTNDGRLFFSEIFTDAALANRPAVEPAAQPVEDEKQLDSEEKQMLPLSERGGPQELPAELPSDDSKESEDVKDTKELEKSNIEIKESIRLLNKFFYSSIIVYIE